MNPGSYLIFKKKLFFLQICCIAICNIYVANCNVIPLISSLVLEFSCTILHCNFTIFVLKERKWVMDSNRLKLTWCAILASSDLRIKPRPPKSMISWQNSSLTDNLPRVENSSPRTLVFDT
jgi:hypothetical protein